jgi:phosphoribosyl-ATP pyrophosphohydrolase/phosphoribosyl-AMP cyclohydrolase
MSEFKLESNFPEQPDFSKSASGLVPAIVQHDRTGEVLMQAWMSKESWAASLESGYATFFSRSRQEIWRKGETSGNLLKLVDARLDCDRDSLLLKVLPTGAVCHLGTSTCWGEASGSTLTRLQATVQQRAAKADEADQSSSYTVRLLEKGTARIAQKVGEEGVETALAAVKGDREELKAEIADLMFHLTVLLQDQQMDWKDVWGVLESRARERAVNLRPRPEPAT